MVKTDIPRELRTKKNGRSQGARSQPAMSPGGETVTEVAVGVGCQRMLMEKA